MMTIPTNIIMDLTGSLFANLAAMGAATTPPKISPIMTCQYPKPITVKKVIDEARDTKNSVKLTLPIVYLGCLPEAMSVEETIGPQPPPPMESK